MSRPNGAPYRYDRQKIREMLLEKGLEETLEEFPSESAVMPIARLLGLTNSYRRHDLKNKDTWVPLLGTKPDPKIAAEHDLPVTTVSKARRKLGIPPLRERKRTGTEIKLASIPDTDFQQMGSDQIAARYGIPALSVSLERKRRNISQITTGRGFRTYKNLTRQELRRKATIFLLKQYPQLTLAELGDVFGVSRQYMFMLNIFQQEDEK